MDNSNKTINVLKINNNEMLWLMEILHANTLFGLDLNKLIINQKPIQPVKPNKAEALEGLLNKGFVRRSEKKDISIESHIQKLLETVLFPKRALFVFRDLPGFGRQLFHVACEDKKIIFHSFSEDQEHILIEILQPEQIVQFIAGWFPFFQLPVESVNFKINKTQYEEIDRLASNGKINEAVNFLNPEALDPKEKENLIRAMAEKKISGSVAWLEVNEGKISAGDSISLITDGRTGWMISQEELPKPEGTILTVSRTGADFIMKIREMVEKLTGIPVPRRQADPTGITISFALSLDELSVALASINCVDFSRKMYAGLSGDHTGEFYGERMMKAQQSLIDNGLCSLSERGLPILKEDLAQSVFSLANSDSMFQITSSDGGPTSDTGVYIVRGRFFTSYRNFGNQFQLLEFGKYKELAAYLESLFPEIGIEKDIRKKEFGLSFDSLQKAFEKVGSPSEIIKILTSSNVPQPDAKMLAEDFSGPTFRATITRRDAPDRKKKKDQNLDLKEEKDHLRAVFLLKSTKRSWMFRFHAPGEKGTATITDRESFRKALSELIA